LKKYGPSTFGELNAEDYDLLHDPGTTDEAVTLLAELIGKARTLELAIGTGRVALPLAKRGVPIEGMDASPDMVAKLKEKPGGDEIPVTIADMADFSLEGRFDFAYLIFNTLYNLTSQEEQVNCFECVSKCLNKGGAFLVEAFVPDLKRLVDGYHVRPRHVGFDTAVIELSVHDPVTQVINYQNIRMSEDGVRMIPLPMRYAWPSEIDLMARLAGLELDHRWGGWDRAPFTSNSDMHVSVYRKV